MIKLSKSRKKTSGRNKKTAHSGGPGEVKNWRLVLVLLGFVAAIVVIAARLVQIQILQHETYKERATSQQINSLKLVASRGTIYDCNNVEIAIDDISYKLSVYVRKKSRAELREIARKLAGIIRGSYASILNRLHSNTINVSFKQRITEEQAKKITELKLADVNLSEQKTRRYPLGNTMAGVIGFTNADHIGVNGIEFEFNEALTETDGRVVMLKDVYGNERVPIEYISQDYRHGDNIILTIDNVIQNIAEEELEAAVSKHNAQSGTAIILDPNNGQILAMASAPGFDANAPGASDKQNWRIRAVMDMFEPGSTFKIVGMAAGLKSGKITPGTKFHCENGRYRVFGGVVNDSKKYGTLAVNEIMQYSSNIGMTKIASRVGAAALFEMARKFGFGIATGIELPSEARGILKQPAYWSRFTLAAFSYGHEIAATSLQMALAYAAIANGGELLKPVIVKEIVTADGNVKYRSKRKVIRRVIDSDIAHMIKSMLIDVVENGTGKPARMANLKIAGKTGTAQKPTPEGGYYKDRFVSSFAGFYPAEKPEYLIYINIDDPHGLIHTGSGVAAPAFKKMTERLLKYKSLSAFHMTYREVSIPDSAIIPDVKNRGLDIARGLLQNAQIPYKTEGLGWLVRDQKIIRDENNNSVVVLTMTDPVADSESVLMPDLSGKPLRLAVAELAALGLRVKIFGSGEVTRQEPKPGTAIKAGSTSMLECRPPIKLSFLN